MMIDCPMSERSLVPIVQVASAAGLAASVEASALTIWVAGDVAGDEHDQAGDHEIDSHDEQGVAAAARVQVDAEREQEQGDGGKDDRQSLDQLHRVLHGADLVA